MDTTAATRARNAATVNHGQMSAEFKKLKEDIQLDFATQLQTNNASLTRDLTLSIATELKALFNEKIKETNERIDGVVFDLQQHIDQQKKEVAELKTAINQLRMNIPYQLVWDNEQHMRNRHKSCRIHGFNSVHDTPHQILSDVYDKLIVPSFNAAVKDGLLKSLPPLYACVEYGHKLPPRQDSNGPAVIIIKFISRLFSQLFLKYSRDVVKKMSCKPQPQPARDDDNEGVSAVPVNYAAVAAPAVDDKASSTKLRVGRDLTPILRSVMTSMFADKGIGKVRLAGEKIQWKWSEGSESSESSTVGSTWLTCHNPYAKSYTDMQIKVVQPGANPLMLD